MGVLTADRDLTKLTPAMQERVANFLRECERRDCHVFVTEGYRTYPRQLWLYSFGRSGDNKDKGAVTWTMKSKHLEGLACDIAFSPPQPLYGGNWTRVFEIAEECGLRSLWKHTGMDKPHLEFDPDWKGELKDWGLEYEDKLIKAGVVKGKADLDATLSRREVYKLIVESIKRLNQENLL